MICDALWLYITANNKNDTYLNTNIYKPRTLLAGGDCKSRAAAAGGRGGRAGSVARRPHGGGRPRRGENTMKSEEQSRGQAKGFSQAGGCFRFDFLCARNEFGAPCGARICFYISLQDALDLSNSFDRSS